MESQQGFPIGNHKLWEVWPVCASDDMIKKWADTGPPFECIIILPAQLQRVSTLYPAQAFAQFFSWDWEYPCVIYLQ